MDTDIRENDIIAKYQGILEILLLDRTTGKNIYWATDSYAELDKERIEKGEVSMYSFYDHITIDKITGPNGQFIRPRALKSREEQTQRSKDKAEVFTPAWICNAQNNLIDEAWFGRNERLFNTPDPEDPHRWITNEKVIDFSGTGKTWKDYVADTRMEITCGEAPYLANRYDVVSGEYNGIAKYRIGILDRKLRIVSENAKDSREWILWAKIAMRSTYGFEWQGDNLLLAREALFFTFAEHYIEQFGEKKFNQNRLRMMPDVAYIISWNIWQMDGLSFGLPGYEENLKNRKNREVKYALQLKEYQHKLIERSLFDEDVAEEPILEPASPYERVCIIKDFLEGVNLKKPTLKAQDFNDEAAPIHTFESIVNEDNKTTI